MSAGSSENVFPPGLTLSGGIPTKHPDFVASIIFVVLYSILVPLAILRIVLPSSRTSVLIRPVLFVAIRIATYVIRAMQANGSYDKNLFIAEQILMLCGFVFLASTLINLVGYQLKKNWIPTGGPKSGMLRVHAFGMVLTTVAVVLGIYSGYEMTEINNDQSNLDTVKDCRDVNVIISLLISGGCAAASIATYLRDRASFSMMVYTVTCGGFLSIASIYKLILYFGPSVNPLSTRAKAVFYVFSVTPEFIVATLFFCINLNEAFSIREGEQKDKDDKAMRKGTYQGSGYTSNRNTVSLPQYSSDAYGHNQSTDTTMPPYAYAYGKV